MIQVVKFNPILSKLNNVIAEEHLAALKEELFVTDQQLRDASDQLERVQQAIQNQVTTVFFLKEELVDVVHRIVETLIWQRCTGSAIYFCNEL